MIESSNDNGPHYIGSDLTFDEMVERKAANHLRMNEVRASWKANNAAMTEGERREACERFSKAFEKIASQFGKSRRIVLDVTTLDKEAD